MEKIKTISVLGAGSWGATIAAHLSKKGYKIKLWEHSKNLSDSLNKKRKLETLPQLKIPKNVIITSDIKNTIDAALFVVVVPSFAFRDTLKSLKRQIAKRQNEIVEKVQQSHPNLPAADRFVSGSQSLMSNEMLKSNFQHDKTGVFQRSQNRKISLVIATKGLEIKSGKTLYEVSKDEFPYAKVAVLTGPSHAEEVSIEMPTAITIASKDGKFAEELQKIFFTPKFRVYTNADIKGCEICGALKNIYAIAVGICDGLGLGDNTKAALTTRSLNEMARLGVCLGGKFETFLGLAGVGDLIVTCYSRHSRNRRLGEMLGRGYTLKQALKKMTMVVEGVYVTKALIRKKLKIDLPIAKEVYKVLFKNKSPQKSILTLMTRPLKTE